MKTIKTILALVVFVVLTGCTAFCPECDGALGNHYEFCSSFEAEYAPEEVEFISSLYKEYNEDNYFLYTKEVEDAYGYNVGECTREYLPHEEYFYSSEYDHWNIDLVYDADYAASLYAADPN